MVIGNGYEIIDVMFMGYVLRCMGWDLCSEMCSMMRWFDV